MKIISFNANSIRVRLHQIEAIIEKHAPDLIGIQETKVHDEEFPLEAINNLRYHAIFHGQKTHYGVALLSKNPAISSQKGYKHDDDNSQRRFISATYTGPNEQPITIINGYFPQGESRDHEIKFSAKKTFYADLLAHLNAHHNPNENLIVMGDMNIAPDDIDVCIGEENQKRWLQTGKCSFLPEEREWMSALKKWGLFDSFRHQHPTKQCLSWFDYRSKGFEKDPKRGLRIDLILVTEPLLHRINNSGIDYSIRAMDKPSDHCPVWVDIT